jgi:AbrB family looped-hinge helix DNA binding protein
MALVKLKRWAQLTLPAEIRRAYQLAEGDYLEVEPVPGGHSPEAGLGS